MPPVSTDCYRDPRLSTPKPYPRLQRHGQRVRAPRRWRSPALGVDTTRRATAGAEDLPAAAYVLVMAVAALPRRLEPVSVSI